MVHSTGHHFVVMTKQTKTVPAEQLRDSRARTLARREQIQQQTQDLREQRIGVRPTAPRRHSLAFEQHKPLRKKHSRNVKSRVFVSSDPFRDTDQMNIGGEPNENYVISVVCGPFSHRWMALRFQMQWCKASRGVIARTVHAYQLAAQSNSGFYIDPETVYGANCSTGGDDEDEEDEEEEEDEHTAAAAACVKS